VAGEITDLLVDSDDIIDNFADLLFEFAQVGHLILGAEQGQVDDPDQRDGLKFVPPGHDQSGRATAWRHRFVTRPVFERRPLQGQHVVLAGRLLPSGIGLGIVPGKGQFTVILVVEPSDHLFNLGRDIH